MFAILKLDGTIDHLTETEPVQPVPPDPLPEDYVAPEPIDYRPVVDGIRPATTTQFSSIVEKPISQWTVTPTEAIREWEEYVPPMSDVRGIKRALLALAVRGERDAGIDAGGFTFASEALLNLLACAHIGEALTRLGNGTQQLSLVLADNTLAPVQAKDVMAIVKTYCAEHHRRNVAMANKLRAVALATTITDVEIIP